MVLEVHLVSNLSYDSSPSLPLRLYARQSDRDEGFLTRLVFGMDESGCQGVQGL